MAAKDCIAAITAAAGRVLRDEEIEAIVSEVQRRVERKIAAGMDPAAAAGAAGRELAGEEMLAAFIERWHAGINIRIRQQLGARVVPGQVPDSIRAILTGFNGRLFRPANFRGAADSVDALRHTLRDQAWGGILLDLERAGLLKAVRGRDAAFDRDLAIEMWRIEDPAGVRGTGNRHAEEAAKILHKYQEALRGQLNEAGAWIGKADHYIVRQSHDAAKIEAAGFEAWRDAIKPKLDPDTFVGRDDPEAFLKNVWKSLASGIHETSTGELLAGFRGPGNLAKRASQERVLHFKDPVSWWEYNEQFGHGRVFDTVLHGIEKGTRDLALMQRLGPNPEAMWGGFIDGQVKAAVERSDFATAKTLQRQTNERILDVITGKADRPDRPGLAKVGSNWRLMQSMAKLGGVVLASLPDLGANTAMLKSNGVGILHGYAEQMRGLLPRSMPEREAAMSLGVGIEQMVGEAMHRFQGGEGLSGRAAASARLFYKLSGLSYWTDAGKSSPGLMLSHHLAQHAATPFDQLPPRMQVALRRYSIEAPEWQRLAGEIAEGEDGNHYLLPAHMADREMAEKVGMYITDSVREGMSEPTAQNRQFATWGTQRGTPAGELVRTMMQFKQYTITYLDRSVARELFRDGVDGGGLAHLMVSLTAFGYLAMTLKELAKGREPRKPEDFAGYRKAVMAAMAQGGGLGIYGDFLFGDYNRLGGGWVSSLGGPTAGTIEDVGNLYNSLRDGKGHPTAEAIGGLKNHAPFVNLFWSRAILDYLFLYRLQEWANPGYLRRMERRVERENNQKFILRPSETVR